MGSAEEKKQPAEEKKGSAEEKRLSFGKGRGAVPLPLASFAGSSGGVIIPRQLNSRPGTDDTKYRSESAPPAQLPIARNPGRLAKLANFPHGEASMNEADIYDQIRLALASAPRKHYISELHLQMIKYADQLKNVTSKEFCEGVGLKPSLGTEFSKMRNLTERLKAAGLDACKL